MIGNASLRPRPGGRFGARPPAPATIPRMKTALVSDLHLGLSSRADLLRHESFRDLLIEATRDVDRLVLLGDAIETRDRPLPLTLDIISPFFEQIGDAFAGREIVLVPGNHDHRLLGPWLDHARESNEEVPVDAVVTDPHPCVERIDGWLGGAQLSVRYPGIWVRDDVFAMHGHYVDSHLTLPTIERLSVAAVDRISGRSPSVRESVRDYEQVHSPVYDLLFDLAQGVRSMAGGEEGRPPSMRLWELAGGATGRARTIRGRLFGSTVVPAVLRGLERAGVGSFGRDFSVAEIGRAGVNAMHTVADRLGIDAAHVIFGHIHRRGPLWGEDGRAATDPLWEQRGRTMHNTGNWLYTPSMFSGAQTASPFWPGSMIVVEDEGAPRLVELLDGNRATEMAAARYGSAGQ